jgi:hypothetical protein
MLSAVVVVKKLSKVETHFFPFLFTSATENRCEANRPTHITLTEPDSLTWFISSYANVRFGRALAYHAQKRDIEDGTEQLAE